VLSAKDGMTGANNSGTNIQNDGSDDWMMKTPYRTNETDYFSTYRKLVEAYHRAQ
jgi:hypothetical protein